MRNLNVRSYILVLVFGLTLMAVIIIGIQQGWGLFRLPTVEKSFNEDAVNEVALQEGAIDMLAVGLFMKLIPPSSSEDERLLTLQLGGIETYVRDDNDTLDVEEACIELVTFIIHPENDDLFQYQSLLTEPICLPATDDLFIPIETSLGTATTDNFYIFEYPLDATIPYETRDPDVVSLNFWYPYDGFDLPVWLLVGYSVTLTDGTIKEGTLPPYMAWDIQTSGSRMWDVQLFSETATEFDEDFNMDITYEKVTIAMARPWLYRILFPFFIVMMVLLIGLVPLLGDRDTLVDISAAMLFGIFGLKGILSPGDQMGRTVLDIALIALYVILAFAGILFFINKIALRFTDSPDEQQPTE